MINIYKNKIDNTDNTSIYKGLQFPISSIMVYFIINRIAGKRSLLVVADIMEEYDRFVREE